MNRAYAVLLVGLLAALSGCATDLRSRTARIDMNNQKLSVYATGKTGPFSDDIQIFVNDQKIAEGVISSASTSTNFSGVYNGARIDAECSAFATGGINMAHKCLIFVDGKKGDEITF